MSNLAVADRQGISAAPKAAAAAAIAIGGALSAAIDLDDQRAHRITLPAAWTAAALTFQVSTDGTTFTDLYDGNGEVTLSATVVAANRSVVVDPLVFLGIRYLKIRSGTGAAPVAQAAARSLAIDTVAR